MSSWCNAVGEWVGGGVERGDVEYIILIFIKRTFFPRALFPLTG